MVRFSPQEAQHSLGYCEEPSEEMYDMVTAKKPPVNERERKKAVKQLNSVFFGFSQAETLPFYKEVDLITGTKVQRAGDYHLIAEGMYEYYFHESMSIADVLQTFSSLMLAIDLSKSKAHGVKAQTETENALIITLIGIITERRNWKSEDVEAVKGFATSFQHASGNKAWLYPKLENLAITIDNKLIAQERVPTLSDHIRATLGIDEISLSEMRTMSSELLTGIEQLRSYTLKSAYCRDPLLPQDKAWVFIDPHDIIIDGVNWNKKTIAIVKMVPWRNITSLTPAIVKHERGVAKSYDFDFGFDAESIFYLEDDGEMYCGVFKTCPVRKIVSRNQLAALELVRAIILARIHDMLVPAILSRGLPNPTTIMEDKSSAKGDSSEDVMNRLRLIMAPRIKFVKEKDLIKKALQEEKEMIKKLLQDDGLAPHQVQRVVGHLRLLPEGYKPTERAFELAREYQFDLERINKTAHPLTVTFVSPHSRHEEGEDSLYEIKLKSDRT